LTAPVRLRGEAVLVDVLSDALFARFPSHHKEGNTSKLLSTVRHAFDGHLEPI
jgi:6-phosphogluconate dehydrogenase